LWEILWLIYFLECPPRILGGFTPISNSKFSVKVDPTFTLVSMKIIIPSLFWTVTSSSLWYPLISLTMEPCIQLFLLHWVPVPSKHLMQISLQHLVMVLSLSLSSLHLQKLQTGAALSPPPVLFLLNRMNFNALGYFYMSRALLSILPTVSQWLMITVTSMIFSIPHTKQYHFAHLIFSRVNTRSIIYYIVKYLRRFFFELSNNVQFLGRATRSISAYHEMSDIL